MSKSLPRHLRKYIVTQNYEKYTPLDQAVWRYILRQLAAYLQHHAVDCYLEGLDKTGISTERIPKIDDISKALEPYGWRALPVSGFIPPAAFMELQARGVLPIASELRTLEHLTYTPAPDIVHEAAGHAPILIHPEFSKYLREYATVAQKAIMSKEDLAVYEAIRDLSDIKENPESTAQEIEHAQRKLNEVQAAVAEVSEAAQLARMNWWTAEYGLLGDLANPKIFGAGLLSSVGEAKWCLSEKVKKIPLTVACLETSYDITEPQPQLFVAPNFTHLSKVLQQMAETMAFRQGGVYGLQLAQKSRTINTVQYNSGLQVGGVLDSFLVDEKAQPTYLRFSGPCQLALNDEEIPGHSRSFHTHGFGSPIGRIEGFAKCLSEASTQELANFGASIGSELHLKFTSGIEVRGHYQGSHRCPITQKLVLLSFSHCVVQDSKTKQVLFEPSWGTYDMAVGSMISSVFGGPPDRESFGELEDFKASRVPVRRYSSAEKKRFEAYQLLRNFRESAVMPDWQQVDMLVQEHQRNYSQDWLFFLEVTELFVLKTKQSKSSSPYLKHLNQIKESDLEKSLLIEQGLALLQ